MPIGKLLDARLCLDIEVGIVVKIASIEKQWQLLKYKRKPNGSGEDIPEKLAYFKGALSQKLFKWIQ